MNKLDRIVEKAVEEWVSKEATINLYGVAEKSAKAVAKASFDETNRFVEKLLDDVEDLIERYVVNDARWRSWIKKQRRKWQDLKKRWCGGEG